MGDLGVPVGDYAREAFQDLGLAEALHSRLVPMVNEPAVLNAVAGGACERGVAYATGSLRQGEAVTVLATFPADSHRPIHYKGCILADADHPRAAHAFLDFVTGGEGAALLQAAGLRAPTAPLYGD